MSTSAPAGATASDSARVTWRGSVRAEAIRFWSLHANRWTILAAALSTAVLAAMEAAFWAEGEPVVPGVGHTLTALSGVLITQLIVGVMGALSMTAEYGTGNIVTSTLATPRRSWVLSAKAVVLAAIVFPVTLAAGTLSFLTTGMLLESEGRAVQSIGDPGVVGSISGSAVYLTAVTLIGLGVGALIRSTAGSVAIVLGGVYALPELTRMALPASWYDTAGMYLPSTAGEALWSPVATDDLLSAPIAALVLGGWLTAVIGLATVTLVRRDT